MEEYISKTEVLELIKYVPIASSGAVQEKDIDAWMDGITDTQEAICEAISNMTAANVVERKRGEWIEHDCFVCNSDGEPVDKIGIVFVCSECGREERYREPFCHCGADMRV